MFDLLEKLFNLNLSEYENIGLNFPIGLFLILLLVSASVAVFFLHFHKKLEMDALTALVRHGAESEECAKTLDDMSIDTPAIRKKLSRGSRLSYMIISQDREKLSYEEFLKLSRKEQLAYSDIDFENAKFYLNPESLDKAKRIVEKDNVSIISPIIIATLSIALIFVFGAFLPDILELIDGALRK
jgi:hypothetical protein